MNFKEKAKKFIIFEIVNKNTKIIPQTSKN